MSLLDPNEKYEDKVKWEILVNDTWCLEQIMEVVLHKTAALQPLASNLTKNPRLRRHAGHS